MNPCRCGVVGVGYLGRFHAQKYASLENAELVGVVDAQFQQAKKVAEECATQAYTDHKDLLGKVDAVSIAVPTTLHYQVAKDFLSKGVHVLLEKPMTVTVDEARELNRITKEHGALLQVGHLERFNPALMKLTQNRLAPRFIESHRLAPFKTRGSDVNVVLDLMIHDVDIILDLVRSPIRSIVASGAKILSQETDIANARIEFESGCVANVTASRVSLKTERKMRVFLPDTYASVDFQLKKLSLHKLGQELDASGIPKVVSEEFAFGESDPLKEEIIAFLKSIQEGAELVVSGEDGQRALEAAQRITELLSKTSL